MDSYASLLEKKQYDLLLKMTQTDTSMNGLFVRTRALIGLGKLEEALLHIKEHQKEMEVSRRALMTIHLEILLELERYQEAEEALDYYDSLPYENYELEEYIKDIRQLVRHKAQHKPYHQLSVEEIKDSLLHPQSEGEMLFLLEGMRTMNLHLFLDEIKQFLLNSQVNDTIKTYALLLLVDQKIMDEIEMVKSGLHYHVVPYELDPPFVGAFHQRMARLFSRECKDPNQGNIALDLWNTYVMEIYPEMVEEEEETLLLASFLALSYQYLSQDIPYETLSATYHLPLNVLQAKVEEIDEVIQRTPMIHF